MRLVVDTNVLVSALLVQGSLPAQLVTLWREERFDLMSAPEQLDELTRVTSYPKICERLTPALAGRLINELRRLAIIFPELPELSVCADPYDNYLLALAQAAHADFLVTGDKRDVLGLQAFQGTRIVTVRTFLAQIGRCHDTTALTFRRLAPADPARQPCRPGGDPRRGSLVGQPEECPYLERAGHGEDREGPMFRPLRGNAKAHDPAGRLDPDAIDRLVRKHVAAIGLARSYSAHSMRATFITTALENGAQLEDVQKAAGHRDPSTTKLYDRRGYNPEKAASFFRDLLKVAAVPISHIHTYLVHPAKAEVTATGIGGTDVALSGKMFDLLKGLYDRADADCNISISFNPSSTGEQKNPCRDLILQYKSNPSLLLGTMIAQRLAGVTDRRSGLGLLFLVSGQEGKHHKIIISRFPADSGILAEQNDSGLNVKFLERVFMKSAKSYKAVVYQGTSLDGDFWSGKAGDKQINSEEAGSSRYWISEFLDSDFVTTPDAGTRRLAVALRNAASETSDLVVKSEIIAASTLAPGLRGQKLSMNDSHPVWRFRKTRGRQYLEKPSRPFSAKNSNSMMLNLRSS